MLLPERSNADALRVRLGTEEVKPESRIGIGGSRVNMRICWPVAIIQNEAFSIYACLKGISGGDPLGLGVSLPPVGLEDNRHVNFERSVHISLRLDGAAETQSDVPNEGKRDQLYGYMQCQRGQTKVRFKQLGDCGTYEARESKCRETKMAHHMDFIPNEDTSNAGSTFLARD